MDYRIYHCDKKDFFICLAISIGIGGVIAWLFYKSWHAMPLFFPIFWLVRHYYAGWRRDKRRERLLNGFRESMQAVCAALLAGYSMENAWRESEKELAKLYGKESEMVQELHQMNIRVSMNQALEQVFAEFAERSGCEDIESFSEVFSFAKRSGGDFAGIIRSTVQRMNARMEVEQEIAVVIAGKKMEGRIMNLMPVFLMIYLNLSSGEFIAPLYGNLIGVCVMTGALFVYAGAMQWSEKIMNIKI